ncbi:hypothetical protein JJE66_19920 [Bradyrhizobium diazoefficiens]|uniref:hypothetical protein n=1 Tax=Bradyrhizobium diazoefficiens TaxID=1355477 RepID=UPI00190C75C3|nr:hypothetical protein [Bradyrhizobium diazoefficiens]MBK3663478.1 hypothetical protein [Bradyrhizobium diazoefficiens]
MFGLHRHFVPGERIGIDEIDAEQLLTIGLRRANDPSITSTPWMSRVAMALQAKVRAKQTADSF